MGKGGETREKERGNGEERRKGGRGERREKRNERGGDTDLAPYLYPYYWKMQNCPLPSVVVAAAEREGALSRGCFERLLEK